MGSNRQGVPFRDRRGHGVPSRSLQRTLATPRLSLHVRPRVHRRLPGVLGDRGWLQRLRRAPRAPDVAMIAVSRAPIAALQAYKRRMGWTFTWASSLDSDFNYDFNTSFTEEQQRSGSIDYNYRTLGTTPGSEPGSEAVKTSVEQASTFQASFRP